MKNIRPWCSLCGLLFAVEDDVVVTDNGIRSQPLKYYIEGPERPRQTSDSPSPYPSSTYSDSPSSDGDDFYHTSWMETLPHKQAACCHLECIQYVGNDEATLAKLIAMLAPKYAPYLSTLDQGRRWIERKFDDALSRTWKLPAEITHQIVQLSFASLRISYSLSLIEGTCALRHEYSVESTQQLWARWVPFEGNLYINALSNKPFDTNAATEILSLKTTTALYVAHDHLGVRKILPACPESRDLISDKWSHLWWDILCLSNQTRLQVEADGVKIRRVSPDGPEPVEKTYWAIPRPSQAPCRQETLRAMSRNTKFTRLSLFAYNSSNIEAYSACWLNGPLTILAHTHGEKNVKRFSDWAMAQPGAIWLYMPMDEGESICEIWKRKGPPFGNFDLVMRTNEGRIWTIGPQPKAKRPPVWKLLEQPTAGASHFFIQDSWCGIDKMAFETESPLGSKVKPPIEASPPSPYPLFGIGEEVMHTKASLADVSYLSLCRHTVHKEASVIGLLLHYRDGRVRNVGQIRLDKLESRVDAENTEGVSFKLSADTWKVIDVDLSCIKGNGWVNMPWSGKLGWWFSDWRSKIYHEPHIPGA